MGLATEHGGSYVRAGDGPRGCWYYLRYFFLFVSLIQLLIILGLVLFMVYGNVHVGTESNLQATERRADGLYSQVQGLSAAHANLTKELNLTARTRDYNMQMLLSARRELDRINASFRQCQVDRVTYANNERYMAAIILSGEQCQEQLKKISKNCSDSHLNWDQKVKTLELEMTKEKEIKAKENEAAKLARQAVEAQMEECRKAQEWLQQEQQLAAQRLQRVETLCIPLDRDKFETDLRNLWRDSIIPRSLDTLSYSLSYHPVGSDLSAIRRACDHMPSLMTTKVEELARNLRADIQRLARENEDLQRQKLEAARSLEAAQKAKEKAEKETQAREARLQEQCDKKMQLVLEEKAALRKERDGLAQSLAEKQRQVEQLKTQLDVHVASLDTCLKAKSQSLPVLRPMVPAPPPPPPPFDPAALEEFKRRILASQRPSAGYPAAPSSG